MDRVREQEMLEELRWLEGLARRLVSDPHEARDLSQTALLASVQGAPVEAPRRRRWLAGTLRHLASKARRTKSRRRGIERMGARGEALPSAQELSERAELQRVLLGLVQDLPAGYRTPILLRYYEGASVAEIADRMELPPRTVHTRLHRGMQRLRESMDRAHPGGREGWIGALLLAHPGLPAAPPAPGAPSSPVPWGALAGGLLVTAATVTSLLGGSPGGPESEADQPAPRAAAEHSDVPSIASDAPVQAPARVALGSVESTGSEATSAVPAPLPEKAARETVVLDWQGRPVADAVLDALPFEGFRLPLDERLPERWFLGPEKPDVARTDADGRATLPALSGEYLLRARAPGQTCAVAALWDPSRVDGDPFVLLAPAMSLDVQAFDGSGRPLAGVRAWVRVDESATARFARSFHRHPLERWSATSTAAGLLRFPEVPRIEEATFVVAHPEYGVRTWPLSEAPTRFTFAERPLARLVGTVVDGGGRGVAGATVLAGDARVATDAGGHFELACGVDSALRVGVAAPGFAPVRFELDSPGARDGAERDGEHFLGPVPLVERAATLSGVVVDPDGRPVAGLLVWPRRDGFPDVAGGGVAGSGGSTRLESLAAGGDGVSHVTRTDVRGAFELGGMDPSQAYGLVLLDEATALTLEWEPVRPGGALRIPWDARQGLRSMEGRLVSEDGRPFAHAHVQVQRPSYSIGESTTFAHGSGTRTDADGRFRLESVPARGVNLRADHPDMPLTTSPVERRTQEPLWVLPRLARLRVELEDPSGEATIELLDGNGETLTLRAPTGLGVRPCERLPLVRGRSPLLDVPCTAATLVLRRTGTAPAHYPVRLEAGRSHTLRY